MEEPLIELKDIYKIYHMGTEEVRANDGISLNVMKGEFVAIVGKSGSGKSTLMNIIGALDVPTSGSYLLGGEDVDQMSDDQLADIRNRQIGFIFQQYYLLPNMSVDKNVKMGADLANNKDYKNVIRAVGLGEKLHKYPSELSGGEQQRVSIARALAKRPRVLFLDEPTGALDSHSSQMLLSTIQSINEQLRATILMVTHDAFTASYANRILFLKDGEIFMELRKGNDSRSDFFDKILNVLTMIGGGQSHVC